MVAYDFGIKHNIMRRLASHNCRITIVPARYAPEKVLELQPDGIFLSNGPVSSLQGPPSCSTVGSVALLQCSDTHKVYASVAETPFRGPLQLAFATLHSCWAAVRPAPRCQHRWTAVHSPQLWSASRICC